MEPDDRRTLYAREPTMRIILIFGLAILEASCQREERTLRIDPPVAMALNDAALMPNGISGRPPEVYFALNKPYETNAYDLSQGKRLYTWFGCKGCHGDGQGGSGPSYLDGWWYYGPEMVSVFASIRDGRPYGMPAFGDKMTTEQIWQLAGYVRTIGDYSPKTAAPSRDDSKQTRPAENRGPAAIHFDPGPIPLHPDQGPTP
jgi:cytochrome c oxidase cbb3-type subunit 3